MNNLLSAIQSVGYSIRLTLLAMARQDATWGFLIGFLITTGLFAIMLSKSPGRLCSMLCSSQQDSFVKLSPRDAEGKFCASFTAHQREHMRVRLAFYLLLAAILCFIIVAMLRFTPA